MAFLILCLFLYVLMALNIQPDKFGWLMIVGFGWFTGYMDCRLHQKSDTDSDRVLPPDVLEDSSDAATFQDISK